MLNQMLENKMKQEKEVIIIKVDDGVNVWQKLLAFGVGVVAGVFIFAYYFNSIY